MIVPGGVVDTEMERPEVIDWLQRSWPPRHPSLPRFAPGPSSWPQAGLLQGKQATTHWEDLADLGRLFPDVDVVEGRRWVDVGSIVTSAGISAGIDMSLHLVARLAGVELARKTARQMQYDWWDDEQALEFPPGGSI